MVFALESFLEDSKCHDHAQGHKCVYVRGVLHALLDLVLDPLLRLNGQKPRSRSLAGIGEVGKIGSSEGVAREGAERGRIGRAERAEEEYPVDGKSGSHCEVELELEVGCGMWDLGVGAVGAVALKFSKLFKSGKAENARASPSFKYLRTRARPFK